MAIAHTLASRFEGFFYRFLEVVTSYLVGTRLIIEQTGKLLMVECMPFGVPECIRAR